MTDYPFRTLRGNRLRRGLRKAKGKDHPGAEVEESSGRHAIQKKATQNIFLVYEGSIESQQALLNCKDLSQWEHAKVHLLSVMPHDLVAMGHESAFVIEKLKRVAA
jgi:hypothetical protein